MNKESKPIYSFLFPASTSRICVIPYTATTSSKIIKKALAMN